MRGKWWTVAVGVAMLFGLIHWSNAHHWEKRYLQQVALIEAAKREAAEQKAANEKRVAAATSDYAERLASIQPIVVRSRDTVREYAQTEAGRAECLPADRVAGVQRDREALFSGANPGAPESSTRAVPPASPALRTYE